MFTVGQPILLSTAPVTESAAVLQYADNVLEPLNLGTWYNTAPKLVLSFIYVSCIRPSTDVSSGLSFGSWVLIFWEMWYPTTGLQDTVITQKACICIFTTK
jgi:hypothetical protein